MSAMPCSTTFTKILVYLKINEIYIPHQGSMYVWNKQATGTQPTFHKATNDICDDKEGHC